MGKPKQDQYEKIMKNEPAVAAKILAELCRFKDSRIAELKTEIHGLMVKREFEGRE